MTHTVRRGRPLMFLLLLLGSWTLARAALWESPWPAAPYGDPPGAVAVPPSRPLPVNAMPAPSPSGHPALSLRAFVQGQQPRMADQTAQQENVPTAAPTLTWLAAAEGFSLPPMPSHVGAARQQGLRQQPSAALGAKPSRWRGDAWLFLRQGSEEAAAGARAPLYGASQVGAVVALRLAPAPAHRPEAYVRASKALVPQGESEAALGLRVAPYPALPVTLHAEARLTRREGSFELRPGAFVTAGFDKRNLPGGLAVQGYGQAGYVGGRHASGFADAMILADREVARAEAVKVRLGAGLWGGAQHGAARLDAGPTISLQVPVAGAPVRLSGDYRIRIAGDAAPGAGAALTLSTGF